MYMPSRFTLLVLPLLSMVILSPEWAAARAEPGTIIENVELRTLTGGREKLLSNKVKANVFVFFRPNNERSADALKQMASCEKELSGKPVHWVAIVSSSENPEEVKPMVAASGIKMPVLIDDGDILYDKLGIRLHPMVGVVDGKFKLLALEQYRQIEYCDIIRGRIQIALGEATEADVAKLENPEKSIMPGDDPMKKALRDVNMARRLYENRPARQGGRAGEEGARDRAGGQGLLAAGPRALQAQAVPRGVAARRRGAQDRRRGRVGCRGEGGLRRQVGGRSASARRRLRRRAPRRGSPDSLTMGQAC